MTSPLLIQYQVLSEQRLHFGRLYWQSVAFLFALLLAAAAIFKNAAGGYSPAFWLSAGTAAVLMSFVTERVRRLEGQYEARLEAIETALRNGGEPSIQLAPKAGKFGARVMVTAGLFMLGLGFFALGISRGGLPT
jgi:hypothetical protein